LKEAAVIASVFPVVAPEVKVSIVEAGASVNPGVTTVTMTVVDAVVAIVEFAVVPVPVMVAVSAPLVPGVVVTLIVLLAVPPEVRVTVAGDTVQVPAAVPVPLRLAAPQARARLPAKPLTEATVTVLVTVLPEMSVPETGKAAGDGVKVKDEAVRLTMMVAEVMEVVPLVPVIAMSRTPDVPALVVMVSEPFEVPPAVRVTVVGFIEQLPAEFPLAVVGVQVSAT